MVSVPNPYVFVSHEMNIINQVNRLHTISEPKIIILGGSNCGFGICSPMIQQYYRMPISNTGTHGGIGLHLYLRIFQQFISKGDIIIVSPEYSQFYGDSYLGEETALRILTTIYPEGYKLFNITQQIHLLKYVYKAYSEARWAETQEDKSFVDTISPYSYYALNEYGDVELYAYRAHRADAKWKVESFDAPINNSVIEILQELHRYCGDKGAKMLIFPPAYRAEAYEHNKQTLNHLWNKLYEVGLPVVSTPQAYSYVDSLFYDNNYHLSYDGVIERTSQLIIDIDSLGIISLQ